MLNRLHEALDSAFDGVLESKVPALKNDGRIEDVGDQLTVLFGETGVYITDMPQGNNREYIVIDDGTIRLDDIICQIEAVELAAVEYTLRGDESASGNVACDMTTNHGVAVI